MGKTYVTKPAEVIRKWYIIDAEDKILGRVATEVANLLRGKNKPTFSPSVDTGDFVVIINADKIKTTGNKEEAKIYYRHSWYPGGLKETTLKQLREKDATAPIKMAVKGMLPKNKLADQMIKRLKVYAGTEHPHSQQLEEYEINSKVKIQKSQPKADPPRAEK
ncbi:TPA: 50S ribosomal protein L13 [candidate division CPR2 bacterium]|uniref:Large ribosomal subunit protein uL13 n=1 Tax=candidate division CPR2 bacterium GW2011_GWC1_41_48 TaxID=1618344 RepID=A0A0G0W9Y4_UNCC2|nr:MAG: 50S ribosomal protein L13 [candidate division CPR2 bacterium GW2011_GWC2_39_35]KKR27176.1 MAG: 50S ribosomal protein L13 [candidate division CPR2 bacterium GW2011_GWD2_39_7]KKR29186.1 MAG: 50S ribosomal protein L13 [candidate division CPR2 bacterium GW2011_GWD1_39_7]KKS08862.1 MAG: 50S ribosomal protein L13, large subunit ribosomal protein L13 [candidate division CPR2 bacterium GW2011_GWC1_41_48]OGB62166.1 MAG: 50S ribosomal protein L13 [candidate division CPR2 bacterium GWD1_39_7]OGB7